MGVSIFCSSSGESIWYLQCLIDWNMILFYLWSSDKSMWSAAKGIWLYHAGTHIWKLSYSTFTSSSKPLNDTVCLLWTQAFADSSALSFPTYSLTLTCHYLWILEYIIQKGENQKHTQDDPQTFLFIYIVIHTHFGMWPCPIVVYFQFTKPGDKCMHELI